MWSFTFNKFLPFNLDFPRQKLKTRPGYPAGKKNHVDIWRSSKNTTCTHDWSQRAIATTKKILIKREIIMQASYSNSPPRTSHWRGFFWRRGPSLLRGAVFLRAETHKWKFFLRLEKLKKFLRRSLRLKEESPNSCFSKLIWRISFFASKPTFLVCICRRTNYFVVEYLSDIYYDPPSPSNLRFCFDVKVAMRCNGSPLSAVLNCETVFET